MAVTWPKCTAVTYDLSLKSLKAQFCLYFVSGAPMVPQTGEKCNFLHYFVPRWQCHILPMTCYGSRNGTLAISYLIWQCLRASFTLKRRDSINLMAPNKEVPWVSQNVSQSYNSKGLVFSNEWEFPALQGWWLCGTLVPWYVWRKVGCMSQT